MGIPLLQAARIGTYVVRQHLAGRKRYPLVLMLEPLFRCNLACAGCGKIDYPDEILNQRLSYDECINRHFLPLPIAKTLRNSSLVLRRLRKCSWSGARS